MVLLVKCIILVLTIHYERSVIDVTKLLVKKIKNDDDYLKYITKVKDRPFNDKRYLIK